MDTIQPVNSEKVYLVVNKMNDTVRGEFVSEETAKNWAHELNLTENGDFVIITSSRKSDIFHQQNN